MRGQVTAFIIIGLIIAVVVTGGILISSRVAIERGVASAERQQVRAELVKPVQQFITNCLSQALEQGLDLLGKQGGYIYLGQDGPTPEPTQPGTRFDYQQNIVRYLAFPPIGTVSNAYFSEPPLYPWPSFPRVFREDGSIRYERFFFGYFGRNLLPPLERGNAGSIQDQFDSFIEAKMRQCRLDAFESQGLAFDIGEPNVTSTLGTADTSVLLDWDVTLRDTATGAVTDLTQFAANVPVRLNATYALVRALLDREVTEINFTLAGLYRDGFSVDVVPDQGGPGQDLVQVRDSRSRLKGEPYLFQFGRHNRPPALFAPADQYLNQLAGAIFCAGTTIQLVTLSLQNASGTVTSQNATAGISPPTPIWQANLIISSPASTDLPCAGRTSTLSLAVPFEAIDPDEDKLTFHCEPACPVTLDTATVNQYITLYASNWVLDMKLNDSAALDTQRLTLKVGI